MARCARDPRAPALTNVLRESKVGFIVTNGDPTGLSQTTVADVNFQYRNSNFFGGNVFQSDGYYERSFSSTAGLSLRYRWEYRPGNEIFLGLGQSATIPITSSVPRGTQMSLRVGQTFRF